MMQHNEVREHEVNIVLNTISLFYLNNIDIHNFNFDIVMTL